MPKAVVKPASVEEETAETEETVAGEAAATDAEDESKSSETSEETTDASGAEETMPKASEPSAAELLARLEKAEAEVERLKASKETPSEPVETREGTIQSLATDAFLKTVLPNAKKTFMDEKSTPEERFNAMFDLNNKLVGAVLHDEVRPSLVHIARSSIIAMNRLEAFELSDDARFKPVKLEVMAEVDKLDWKERAKPNAVTTVFHRVIGSKGNGVKGTAESSRTPAPVNKTLKDVAGATGTPGVKGSPSGLTASQKSDLEEINAERGVDEQMPQKVYLLKLKARQDKIKAQNEGKPEEKRNKIPQTLRDPV